MAATYELWLLDDYGRRICLLTDYSYFSYSRSTLGLATLQVGFPYDSFKSKVYPVYQTDRRIDVWRSPEVGVPLRRENTFLLRSHKIYTRQSDGMRMIQFLAWDPTHLLKRRYIIQAAGSDPTRKTGPVDDVMKAIVREQMLWGAALDKDGILDYTRAFPIGEFTVEADQGLGPSVSVVCADRNVLDVLNELKHASFQLHEESIANSRIFFDVVPAYQGTMVSYILDEATGDPILDEAGDPLIDESSSSGTRTGFQFRTFASLRGQDRTQDLEFSVENSNLQEPYYVQNCNEEANEVLVKGYGRGDSRVGEWVADTEREHASRWNRMEGYVDGSQEPDPNKLADVGYSELYKNRQTEEFSAVLLNVAGGPDNPRSLYGLDWDLGDLVRVSYADMQFEAEVVIVYVGMDENGVETITGRNLFSATSGA